MGDGADGAGVGVHVDGLQADPGRVCEVDRVLKDRYSLRVGEQGTACDYDSPAKKIILLRSQH